MRVCVYCASSDHSHPDYAAAAYALPSAGTEAAGTLNALNEALNDPEQVVREQAALAIERINLAVQHYRPTQSAKNAN